MVKKLSLTIAVALIMASSNAAYNVNNVGQTPSAPQIPGRVLPSTMPPSFASMVAHQQMPVAAQQAAASIADGDDDMDIDDYSNADGADSAD